MLFFLLTDHFPIFLIYKIGKLGLFEWAQITVRTRPDKKNHCLEYLCYVKKDYLKNSPIRQGDFIVGVMNEVQHPRGIIWVLQSHTIH